MMNNYKKNLISNYLNAVQTPHFCFDLDGTIVYDSHIEQQTLYALRFLMSGGFFVSIATGRSYMEANSLLNLIEPNTTSALCDGQLSFFYNGNQFFQNIAFDLVEYQALLYKINKYVPEYVEEFYTGYKFSSPKAHRLFCISTNLHSAPQVCSPNEKINSAYLFLPYTQHDRDLLFQTIDSFNFRSLKVVKHGACWLKVSPQNCKKTSAFENSVQNIMYFGNGFNDYEMLMKSHTKIIVQNSDPRLKQIPNIFELEEPISVFLSDLIQQI